MRLGSEPAAESSRMARFADWFVASPVSAEYGITGLTVRRASTITSRRWRILALCFLGLLWIQAAVFASPSDRLVGTNFTRSHFHRIATRCQEAQDESQRR